MIKEFNRSGLKEFVKSPLKERFFRNEIIYPGYNSVTLRYNFNVEIASEDEFRTIYTGLRRTLSDLPWPGPPPAGIQSHDSYSYNGSSAVKDAVGAPSNTPGMAGPGQSGFICSGYYKVPKPPSVQIRWYFELVKRQTAYVKDLAFLSEAATFPMGVWQNFDRARRPTLNAQECIVSRTVVPIIGPQIGSTSTSAHYRIISLPSHYVLESNPPSSALLPSGFLDLDNNSPAPDTSGFRELLLATHIAYYDGFVNFGLGPVDASPPCLDLHR
jgi:hypothetical protein